MAKTILLADDSVTIQKVVELTFMDQDYEVIAVSDGNTALMKLSELQPDILIADVHMPATNGYVVTRQAKQRYPDLPVLLLVGTFEPFDEQEAQACGAEGYLKKPFDSQDLLREVERCTKADAAMSADLPPFDEDTQPLEPLDESDLAELRDAGDLADLEAEPVMASATPTDDAPFELEATEVTLSADDDDLFSESFDEPPLEYLDDGPEPPVVAAEPEKGGAEEPQLASSPIVEAQAPPPVVPAPPAEARASGPSSEIGSGSDVGPSSEGNGQGALSDEDVDRIARRVIELLGDSSVREVAWEIVPDLAEVIIKERIRELESQVE